jgi:hypothetical protein
LQLTKRPALTPDSVRIANTAGSPEQILADVANEAKRAVTAESDFFAWRA